MKHRRYRFGQFFCRALLVALVLTGAVLVPALAQGVLPLLPGLLLGALLLLGINTLCGLLLPAGNSPQRRTVKAKARRVSAAPARTAAHRRAPAHAPRRPRAA